MATNWSPAAWPAYGRTMASTLIVGGTGSLGLGIARRRAELGDHVVLTSRDVDRAEKAAREIGGDAHGLALDLSNPHGIADALSGIGPIDHLEDLLGGREPLRRRVVLPPQRTTPLETPSRRSTSTPRQIRSR